MILSKEKEYHFIAIGGVGQSACAKILALKGYKVSGSDIKESKYTKELRKLNIDIKIGHSENNINENQVIVLSSAIKEDNPEFKKARELNLPVFHRSDILKLISSSYKNFIGFSGTHGKTTSTSLAAFILEKMGAKPAYAAGGIISGLDTNANAYPSSEIFIAELDESDGTIIKYQPNSIVINNLEGDHFDFYKNGKKDLIEKFSSFISDLKEDAKVFLNIDDEGVFELYNKTKNKITYSIKERTANYYAANIILDENFNCFDLFINQKFISKIKTSIKGVHNVYNTLGVLAALIENGYKIQDITPCIFEFTGAKRRFETVFKNSKIQIVDDYAHHPTEIKAALSSARKIAKNNLIAIFQPHRYTRLKALWNDFLKSFDDADELFVVDTFSAGDKFDDKYNSEEFAKALDKENVKYIKGDMDNAALLISKHIKEGSFVITIGAGDVTKIAHVLGEYYEKS